MLRLAFPLYLQYVDDRSNCYIHCILRNLSSFLHNSASPRRISLARLLVETALCCSIALPLTLRGVMLALWLAISSRSQ